MTQSLPWLVAAFTTLALLTGCDRPLAQEANAADTLPQRTEDPAPAPAPKPRPKPPAVVSAPPTEVISDPAITARVNSALHSDPALAGADLSVNTDRGVVSLTGTVKSPEQVAEAAARAQEPDGVVRIDSHLSVIPP